MGERHVNGTRPFFEFSQRAMNVEPANAQDFIYDLNRLLLIVVMVKANRPFKINGRKAKAGQVRESESGTGPLGKRKRDRSAIGNMGKQKSRLT